MGGLEVWHWIVAGLLINIVYILINKPTQVKVLTDNDKAPLLSQAELIINAYGKTLEYLGPVPGSSVADEQKLPFPKAQIKSAIIFAIRANPDKKQQEILKTGYLCLADFQPGVGSKNIGFELLPADVSKLNDSEVLAIANAVGESESWLAKASAELALLRQELQAAGVC